MTGQKVTLDDSTVFSIKKALLNLSFEGIVIEDFSFIFIEGNTVSVINLNYITSMKNFA